MRRTLLLAAVLCALAPAAWAETVEVLVARYRSTTGRKDDFGYESQRKALEALADLDTDESRKALREILEETQSGERRALLIVLGAVARRGGKAEVDLVIQTVAQARDPTLVSGLAHLLGGAQKEEARAYLREGALSNTPPPVKAQVARALGAIGDRAAAIPLIQALRDQDVGVRTETLLALGALKDDTALNWLVVTLRAKDMRLREVGARALGLLGCRRAVARLVAALSDPENPPIVVESVADALGLLEDRAAIGPLIDRLAAIGAKDLRVSDAVVRALERLSGKTLGDDADLWKAWWTEAQTRGDPAPTPEGAVTVAGPRYYGFRVRSSRVVFVIDVSRSMSWSGRLETAQKELTQVIERLPKTATFDLVAFSDQATAWAGKLVPATSENVGRATRFVDRLKPVSGTNIYDGLRLAMADEAADTVFFLSDGSPSGGEIVDPDALLAAVREWNRWRRVRIHTIALLQGETPPTFSLEENRDRAASFLRRLAEENGGQFREIR
jgi:HEAT repeat protein